MSAEPDQQDGPRRRRRRSYEELVAASQADADSALQRYRRKNAKAQKHEAQLKLRHRKLDTRRKIIAGALALEHAKKDEAFRAQLHALLDEYVVRAVERELFGLPPLPVAPATAST